MKISDKREDGYHNLETVFYPLSMPFDEIHLEKTKETGMKLSCNIPGIDPENNTLTKAYDLYNQYHALDFGLDIRLIKGVPHNALPFQTLLEIAAKIGADVPFFLYDTPCKGEGIGEKLTPISLDLTAYSLLLILPDIHISTAWAFKKLAERKKILTSKKEQANKSRSKLLGADFLVNDFETIVFEEYGKLEKTKEILLQQKAVFASLSGTGSALFAFFEEKKHEEQAVSTLLRQDFFMHGSAYAAHKGIEKN